MHEVKESILLLISVLAHIEKVFGLVSKVLGLLFVFILVWVFVGHFF